VSRFSLGLVISTGIAIGTLFTLFVVPAMYSLLAEDHSRQPAGTAPAGGALH
jgi:multidrug efflux pump